MRIGAGMRQSGDRGLSAVREGVGTPAARSQIYSGESMIVSEKAEPSDMLRHTQLHGVFPG